MKTMTLVAVALTVTALPLAAFGQSAAPAPSELELKAKRKTTVVAPKPDSGPAIKDAEAVKRKAEGARRVGEATKRQLPSRPDGDVTGGIQSKGIKGELTK